MTGKRPRSDGGDTRSDEQLEVGNQQSDGAARSIYVVVTTWDTRPVYSVYKVDYPFPTPTPTPAPTKRRRLHPVATLEMEGGKTFASVQSRRRNWIVAVGGHLSTVAFDAQTEEVVHGPALINAKDRPVVVAVEDKVYALSRFPRVSGERDFEPWFQVLDLSRATVVDGRLEDCSWEALPSPPCFPCHLAAHEFFHPPVLIVHSYAVVGTYLLLSLRSNQHATYAFDTTSAKWHKVHGSNSLPFTGRPTPHHHQQHGGAAGLYLGESAQNNDRCSSLARQADPAVISAYAMELSHTSEKDDIKLSVTEFPIKSAETSNVVTGMHYCSLDKGIFCSVDLKSHKQRSWDDEIRAYELHFSKKASLTLRTYQMDDNYSLLQEDETLKKEIAISEQPQQAFKIRTESEGFVCPAFLAVF